MQVEFYIQYEVTMYICIHTLLHWTWYLLLRIYNLTIYKNLKFKIMFLKYKLDNSWRLMLQTAFKLLKNGL